MMKKIVKLFLAVVCFFFCGCKDSPSDVISEVIELTFSEFPPPMEELTKYVEPDSAAEKKVEMFKKILAESSSEQYDAFEKEFRAYDIRIYQETVDGNIADVTLFIKSKDVGLGKMNVRLTDSSGKWRIADIR